MSKGPLLNNISRKLTTRDNLGIEDVANSIAGEICPIVSTVTPRPFYWAFITWCYYDFYSNCSKEDRSIDNVYKYVKIQNFFLALGSVLNGTDEVGGFTGSDNIKGMIDLNQSVYTYNEKYLKNQLSTMGNYTAGLESMGFITEIDHDTLEKYKYPKLTLNGEKLAKAFDSLISKTTFYKEYRKTGQKVPKEVLIELNNSVKINLEGFTEVKNILKEHLFNKESTKKLRESHDYLLYLYNDLNIENLSVADCREIFYDYFSIRSNSPKIYPENLKEIIDSWEIVIGRQYFTMGIEIIWKYMLECLSGPKNIKTWFNDCINDSEFDSDINEKLELIIEQCNFSYKSREEKLAKAKSNSTNHRTNISDGLKVMLSVYNRFNERNDLSPDNINYFNYGMDNNSISLNQFFKLVDSYKEKPIKEFLEYIMNYYLLEQHLSTAFEKMMQGRDGYFIEKIENKYVRKEFLDLNFQNNRMVLLTNVMKDLDILGVE